MHENRILFFYKTTSELIKCLRHICLTLTFTWYSKYPYVRSWLLLYKRFRFIFLLGSTLTLPTNFNFFSVPKCAKWVSRPQSVSIKQLNFHFYIKMIPFSFCCFHSFEKIKFFKKPFQIFFWGDFYFRPA